MREIKVRFWNPYQKRMIAGRALHELAINPVPSQCYDFMMQYTGLKDKNGVDIYEGDVCEIMYFTPFGDKTNDFHGMWEVKKWMAEFILVSGKERLSFAKFADEISSEYVPNLGTVYELSDLVNVNVIGNIHQNSGLVNK
ncbi:hypothetical protein NVP1182O_36 [Vibrio phage 1.182.O._10N.286.46.E1]|nr:hypothetical protein NVP1182O_36 [Vibrio phage 1.182.O._10N.286.46.E1]